eukprot:COSAG04_NODE_737_length_10702_cov_11.388664_8_plen_91_part_00
MGGSQSSPEAMEAAKAVVSGAIAANPVVIFSKTYCERSHRPSAPLRPCCPPVAAERADLLPAVLPVRPFPRCQPSARVAPWLPPPRGPLL